MNWLCKEKNFKNIKDPYYYSFIINETNMILLLITPFAKFLSDICLQS